MSAPLTLPRTYSTFREITGGATPTPIPAWSSKTLTVAAAKSKEDYQMNSLLVMCLVLRGFANDPHPEDKAFYCSKPTTQTELAAHIVPDPSFGRHILFELHPHLAALSTKPKATGSLDVFNDPNAVP